MYKRIICFLCLLLCLVPTRVYADVNRISACNAVVIDKLTNNVLYDKNANQKASMASTTKIMTSLIACERLDKNKMVTITSEMLDGTEGSLIYLKVGDKITVEDLIKGSLLASGNDSANALAVAVSGSINEFVKLMNEYAKVFRMENTSFATPSGLDKTNHYSTAYDMAVLTSKALDNDLFSSICRLQCCEIKINDKEKTLYNHNKLLNRVEDCIGVKTGYTDKSGRCLVSAYDYKGNVIIIVTLNAYDDWNDHEKLFKYAKTQYKSLSKTDYLDINVVGSKKNNLKCGVTYDATYLDDYKISYFYYPIIYAPVIKGTKLGYARIYSNNKLLRTVDIIALESVKVWQITK